MAKAKLNKDRYYYPTANDVVVEERRGASEKPLGPQISMEEQKASRKFLTKQRKPSGVSSGANPRPKDQSNQNY